MNTNNKTQTIPISVFLEAAVKLFKCKNEDIEIRMIEENLEAYVIYKDYPYKISTWEMLRTDVADMLTDPELAQHINLDIWLKATKYSIELSRFLPALVSKIENTEQIHFLQLALSISALMGDRYCSFWKTLADIDRYRDLFGAAIVTVFEYYNVETLTDDITELMILNGIRMYNRIKEGIFETVDLDDRREYPAFYVYSLEDFLPE
jgi:hypothetical protein